ncbi:MAG: hypothetical protein ACTSWK_17670 [Promethearchaeota archaeon]
MKKIWVKILFATYKAILIESRELFSTVQLVGYPFGSYPNGKTIQVPNDRYFERAK